MSEKKKVHWIVSGAGWIATVLSALLAAVCQLGKKMNLTEEDVETRIHRLSTAEGVTVIEQIAGLILGQTPTVAPTDWWNQFLSMMISAGQFVSGVNPNITGDNFPFQAGDLQPKQVEVVSIKQRIRELGVGWLTTQQVKDYIDSLGYRPATLVELLWWWTKNPSKWNDCLVVALGSVWGGHVPFVRGYGAHRSLSLDSVGFDWYEGCGFAVVRK